MLRHEELQSKETASVVMSKIMAAGGPDIKVSNVRCKSVMITDMLVIRLVP